LRRAGWRTHSFQQNSHFKLGMGKSSFPSRSHQGRRRRGTRTGLHTCPEDESKYLEYNVNVNLTGGTSSSLICPLPDSGHVHFNVPLGKCILIDAFYMRLA